MSAIVAAASARSWHVKILRQVGRVIGGPTGAHMLASADYHEQRLAAAGRAIVAASNAAGAGRVVEGAPHDRQWADWRIGVSGLWLFDDFRGPPMTVGMPPAPGFCPTWLGGAWVWSTAAHDPRPCAWPRPFARGTDR